MIVFDVTPVCYRYNYWALQARETALQLHGHAVHPSPAAPDGDALLEAGDAQPVAQIREACACNRVLDTLRTSACHV